MLRCYGAARGGVRVRGEGGEGPATGDGDGDDGEAGDTC